MNTHCSQVKLTCQTPNNAKPRRIEADFSGGHITSDGGYLLSARSASEIQLFERIAECFNDHRDPQRVVHQVKSLVGQRILGLVHGYEDLNDHEQLRKDELLGAMLGCVDSLRADCEALAGKSTLSRLEVATAGLDAERGHKIQADFDLLDQLLVKLFVESRTQVPDRIVLDWDATDFELHGNQQEKFYHGYYREYCYLPLLVFCEDFPVMVRLRTAAKEAAAGVAELLQSLVGMIRVHWPQTHITIRTDSGFCRDPILSYCEQTEGVDYVIGLAGNSRLKSKTEPQRTLAAKEACVSGVATRVFCDFSYQTLSSWSQERRVICKAESLPGKFDPSKQIWECKDNARYIVTSLPSETHPSRALYEDFYCKRGDAENRLRELKCDLFAKRCSSNLFNANTLRLYLSAFAHVVFILLRRGLKDTAWAALQPGTLRLKLLKVGACVTRSVRRIHVALSSAYPDQNMFIHVWRQIAPS